MLWADHHQWDLVFNMPVRFPIALPVFLHALRTVPGDAFGGEFTDASDYDGFPSAELLQHGGFLFKRRKAGVVGEQRMLDDNVLHGEKVIRYP